jgi:hypothetical protein
MKKFRQLSEEVTPSSKPEPGREAIGGRFTSASPKKPTKPAPHVTAEETISEIIMPQVKDDLGGMDKMSFVKKHGVSKTVAKQKLATEAKEKTEYDYEGDMARGQLQSIISNAQRVHDMLEDDTNIAEWVQSKITLAEDYISTVANYMMSELDEAKDVGDIPSGDVNSPNLSVKKGKTVASGPVMEASSAAVRMQRALDKIKQSREASERRAKELLNPKKPEPVKEGHQVVATTKQGETFKSGVHATKEKALSQHYKMAKSGNYKKIDTIKVNESFAETIAHKDKANAAYESGDSHAFHGHMVDHHVSMANFHREHGDEKSAQKHEDKAKEHHTNMQTYYRESIESIDEKLSVAPGQAPRQQGRFAPNDQTRIDKTPTGGRIFTGTYFTGTKKPSAAALAVQASARERLKKMKEETEQIEEGRPSQRHPLEGHEYHKKTDAELVHIAKDAHAAAEAMKSHNTTAENKYRDQANDSATVRHFRKTSGTPDWYKKKYGHMKEAFRPMDEPNYNNSIQARQKKADDANKPPFDGPYKKNTGVVTDKSGAKHGGMSIARNLARQALKKQSSKMSVREGLEESRKAEIVKEIMKKGKKKEDNTFQGEPELGSTVVKADN